VRYAAALAPPYRLIINVISAFSHQRGIVLGVKAIENQSGQDLICPKYIKLADIALLPTAV
jgi:hypothetical protein